MLTLLGACSRRPRSLWRLSSATGRPWWRVQIFFTPSNIFREAVAVLLRVEGVRVNARDGEGNTALHYAQQYNYRRVAKLLKKHGATI